MRDMRKRGVGFSWTVGLQFSEGDGGGLDACTHARLDELN